MACGEEDLNGGHLAVESVSFLKLATVVEQAHMLGLDVAHLLRQLLHITHGRCRLELELAVRAWRLTFAVCVVVMVRCSTSSGATTELILPPPQEAPPESAKYIQAMRGRAYLPHCVEGDGRFV